MHHVEVFCTKNGFLIKPAYIANDEARINAESEPEDATFCFGLTKHDYVEISLGATTYSGYFVMYESDGRLTLSARSTGTRQELLPQVGFVSNRPAEIPRRRSRQHLPRATGAAPWAGVVS